jgi:hypothetical protein
MAYHRRASIMLADGSSAQASLLPTGHIDGRPTIESGGWRPYRSVAAIMKGGRSHKNRLG